MSVCIPGSTNPPQMVTTEQPLSSPVVSTQNPVSLKLNVCLFTCSFSQNVQSPVSRHAQYWQNKREYYLPKHEQILRNAKPFEKTYFIRIKTYI